MRRATILGMLLLCAPWLAAATPQATTQDPYQEPDVLMPEQSAARAKQLLAQTVEAMGGPAYLNVHDLTCTGRLGQFGHAGDLNGFETFIDYTIPPTMDRTENLPKRNIIQVLNGDKGWNLDRGGVAEAPATDVARFQSDIKIDIDNILRHRIHEKDMVFRYGGSDVVDLKEADWVEMVDSDNRTIRIAISKATHLPIEKAVELRDPTTQTRTSELEIYSNYHPVEGVTTPFQITRSRNGIKLYQVFFDKCQYNTGVSESLFTKQSLEDRWEKVDKKHKKKEKKDAARNDTIKD